MVKTFAAFAVGSFLVLSGVPAAMARNIPGHPRVNEIDQRLNNQQHRISNGVAEGQIGPWEAVRDEARVSRQLARGEAVHNGHITLGE